MKMFSCVLALGVACMAGSPAEAVQDRETAKEKLFLMAAAQFQQGEILLGKIATQQAGNPQVRELGQRVVEDYAKANQQATQLANAEGVELFKRLPSLHKKKAEQLARLSGGEFDKAYLDYMTTDHGQEVQKFSEHARQIKNPTVKRWAEQTIPVLQDHVQKADQLTASVSHEAQE
jgi:putative membrane protein